MTKLTVIDLTGKEEVQASGEGFLTRIIRRVVAGERVVGEVVEEQIAQLIMYKAEVRDGLIVHQAEDKFNEVEQAIDAIKHWYQEEEDFIRQASANPSHYQSVMKEFGISHNDFMNNAPIRIEILVIDDKRKEIEVLNRLISDAKSDIDLLSTDESDPIAKVQYIEISNRESEIKRLKEDIKVSEERINKALNR